MHDDAPVSAYGGYVAWSEKGADHRWHLVVWHAGARRVLPQVAPRAKPIDVDLGPDAHGRPTAVFSRCRPRCQLRAITLPGGRERALLVPQSAGASDRTPALWRDRVVFQRRRHGQRVARLIAYNIRRGDMTILRHGVVPRYKGHVQASADAIDLVDDVVAFVWSFFPPRIGVDDEEEVRAERLTDHLRVRVDGGYTSGECGFIAPVSPNATPTGALYASIWSGLDETCADESIHGKTSMLSFRTGGRVRVPAFRGMAVRGVARDAATGATYAIAGQDHHLTLVTAR